jgi:hypothetical protein
MCDSGTNDKPVRMFKVTRADYPGNSCAYGDLATIQDAEFDGAEIGDKITIELIEITEDERENLPEFEGW